MKLAEALIQRADLKRKIAQLESRMENNVKAPEGDEPAEDISDLMDEYEQAMNSLEGLVIRINRTNYATPFEQGNIVDAIAKRDALKAKIRTYRNLHEVASQTYDRYSAKEIKLVRWVEPRELQRTIDALSKKYRTLDTQMQALNWTVDLL